MNLYKISQDENDGYDTFDSAVVAAESEDDAKRMNPANIWEGLSYNDADENGRFNDNAFGVWATNISAVKVELIGVAADGIERGVIVASFNAG